MIFAPESSVLMRPRTARLEAWNAQQLQPPTRSRDAPVVAQAAQHCAGGLPHGGEWSLCRRCAVDPEGYRIVDVLDVFSKAAHAPKMNLSINAALLGFIPKSVKKGMMALAPVRRVRAAAMNDLGLPEHSGQ